MTGDRSAYDYLGGSIEQFPRREAMSAEIARAGFGTVRARPLTLGIVALHEARACASRRPNSGIAADATGASDCAGA